MSQAAWLLPGAAPATPFNPYCICSLRLLRARARPSRLGWTCPRLPAAASLRRRHATLRSRDRAGRWAADSRRTHWLSPGPRSVTWPTAALCCPARPRLAQGGLWGRSSPRASCRLDAAGSIAGEIWGFRVGTARL